MDPFFITFDTPIGVFGIEALNDHIVSTVWDPSDSLLFAGQAGDSLPLLKEAKKQVQAYFSGKLKKFTLPLHLQGTPFKKQVLKNCLAVPYGEVATYQDLAFHAPRAVGNVMHTNLIPLFIPCHRIIPKTGGLGGYMGKEGVSKKKYLLELEGYKGP